MPNKTVLKNINGDILPDTTCSLEMTIDSYYFNNIKLLNRINIDNTTQVGIFKDNRGFPVSIKSININSGSMKLNIQADNRLSEIEQEQIEGEFPDENDPQYIFEGKVLLIAPKMDMRTKLQVD